MSIKAGYYDLIEVAVESKWDTGRYMTIKATREAPLADGQGEGEVVKPDRKRIAGFYWVRFEGDILVAEYTEGRDCSDKRPHWHIPGSAECFKNREVCELLSERLSHGVL